VLCAVVKDRVKDLVQTFQKPEMAFPHSQLLLSFPAIAGLSGASLRLTNTFMIAVAGGMRFLHHIMAVHFAVAGGRRAYETVSSKIGHIITKRNFNKSITT
jgi:hypothetical protein